MEPPCGFHKEMVTVSFSFLGGRSGLYMRQREFELRAHDVRSSSNTTLPRSLFRLKPPVRRRAPLCHRSAPSPGGGGARNENLAMHASNDRQRRRREGEKKKKKPGAGGWGCTCNSTL
ncbi:unnamed protein product [Pleuronectes platessa]|uniref:Uncharacterized protein n=1 Tax=Pleuronectes platessa TaxID=8262 RepID=A0A9N7U5T3_PLEPL|nr:unnamed protein product [Pleuronectes platessa]